MSNDARITVVGNLSRAPEIKFTNSGLAVANFGVAVNERKKDDSGNWVDDGASFYDVKCFGQFAENVAESLEKGNRVVVVGSMKQEHWTTDSGDKRSKHVVMADSVAPDLRWATAHVVRNERKEGGQQSAPSNELENPF